MWWRWRVRSVSVRGWPLWLSEGLGMWLGFESGLSCSLWVLILSASLVLQTVGDCVSVRTLTQYRKLAGITC